MSGLLQNAPGDIVRRLLISKGFGVAPPLTNWPIYHSNEPDTPDNTITVYDSPTSELDRRYHPTNHQEVRHGIQIRVRSATHDPGYIKANQIAIGCDTQMDQEILTIGSNQYCINSIVRRSDVISLGKETPQSKRNLFVINAVVSLKQI